MKKRIESVQGVKGIVAFGIAYIFHYQLLFQKTPIAIPVFTELFQIIGTTYIYASDLFFVISGFFLYKAYEQRLSRREISFGKFMIPKICKIYPLMIVTVVINYVVELIGKYQLGQYPLHGDGGAVRYSVSSLVLNILGLQTGWISNGDERAVNGPSWFISIILVCYILYYLITYFIKNEKVKICVYWAMAIGGIAVYLIKLQLPLLYEINGRGYYGFFVGVLISHYIGQWSDKAKRSISLVVLIGVIGAVCYNVPFDASHLWLEMLVLWPGTVYLAMFAPVIQQILSVKPLVKLGDFAMAIFLCNMPINTIMEYCNKRFHWNLDYGNTGIWLCYVAISLVISWGMYRIFELWIPIILSKTLQNKGIAVG